MVGWAFWLVPTLVLLAALSPCCCALLGSVCVFLALDDMDSGTAASGVLQSRPAGKLCVVEPCALLPLRLVTRLGKPALVTPRGGDLSHDLMLVARNMPPRPSSLSQRRSPASPASIMLPRGCTNGGQKLPVPVPVPRYPDPNQSAKVRAPVDSAARPSGLWPRPAVPSPVVGSPMKPPRSCAAAPAVMLPSIQPSPMLPSPAAGPPNALPPHASKVLPPRSTINAWKPPNCSSSVGGGGRCVCCAFELLEVAGAGVGRLNRLRPDTAPMLLVGGLAADRLTA